MIVLIDNYDSFVYNIARYTRELGFECQVYRNDDITVQAIFELQPTHIIISPGPCTPDEAGISLSVIKELGSHIPILGVCLGHQAIGQVFGAKVTRAFKPMHGMSSFVRHDGSAIFQGLKNPLKVGRYHSLIVSEDNFPRELIVCARSSEREIMGVRHRQYPIYGVQFHPESVLTEQGYDLFGNFLSRELDFPSISIKG